MRELALLFLKLGVSAFGGPQAHIAAINDEAVIRRNWLSAEQFSEAIAVCEMLPGPASTQVAIYTGYLRGGQWGALVAGICFIFPAFLIVLVLSWMYFRFQGLPQTSALFFGISPVVTAIILGFCWKLGRRIINNRTSVAIAIGVLVITLFTNVNVLIQFIVAGFLGVYFLGNNKPNARISGSDNKLILPILPAIVAEISPTSLTLSSFWGIERISEFFLPLSWFFFKVGSFIFGGGLVIIPLLEFQVVEQLHWLTKTEFINGVAIGQLSPGPVVLTAAFVGYKVAGVMGSIVSTIAIFTPSFLFIMLAAPLLQKLRQNPQVRNFLKGVTPAVLGAIAAAAIPLAQTALIQERLSYSIIATVIFILALIALIYYRVATWRLILAGALLGLLVRFV
ncbi:chromate efflux transporter [Myxosarcina sp. GI1]|uniref:chromate efflux transporter n=1 Tax=Myxosarcina sp. GI1 TaxID=1541065 RepID=UPI0005683424|nr:chromate efflux transporter [Myxosarcina sp. GI1]